MDKKYKRNKTTQWMENIYLSKTHENLLGLQLKRCVNGLIRVRSVSLRLLPEERFIINKTFMILLIVLKFRHHNKREKLLTAEFLPKNKKMTLNDKKSFSDSNILSMTWLRILDQELIGTEKVFKPFWNNRCLEMSQKLWFPTETDYVGLHSNSLNSSFQKTGLNSLFSIQTLPNLQLIKNYQMTSCQSSTSTNVDKWDVDVIQKLIKTRKLRIYPNQIQKIKLKEWINTTRYVYNKGVQEIKQNGNQSFQDLRNKLVTSKGNKLTEWELKTPKDIRAGGLRDLSKAYKTAFTNLRNGNIRKFEVKFRTKKSGYQSIEIPKTAIKSDDDFKKTFNVFKTYGLGNIKICKRDTVPKIKFDLRLSHEKNGRWFLLIPFESEIKENKNNERCALDPGIRKFQTIYSQKEAKKITTNYELLRKLKDQISKLAKLRSGKLITNTTYSKKMNKLWTRHTDLVSDGHSKLSNYLAKNYIQIYIPKFESQKLVKKMNRTCNFNILNLQHYKFRELLKHKCTEYSSKMKICTEEFTSQTCTRCGQMNDVGSSEIYKCQNCKLIIDRDINGSRNIYLKCENE
jgi:putative transposase